MTPAHEHLLRETIQLAVYYPDHPPRTESAVFRATKAHWHALHAPCDVCGTDKLIEVHHKFLEWADSEGVDWDRMKARHPDFDWSRFLEPADFVDSVYNTIPLCRLHHRGPAPFGIHFTPYPIWEMQRVMRADFKYAEVAP